MGEPNYKTKQFGVKNKRPPPPGTTTTDRKSRAANAFGAIALRHAPTERIDRVLGFMTMISVLSADRV